MTCCTQYTRRSDAPIQNGRYIPCGSPAIGKKDVEFRIYYISPLGSFATWKSTKQTGSYDMQTFEIHARPTQKVEGLRPGMSVLLTIDD